MEPDDLLCSRNARPEKALVGRAQWKINQPPSLERNERAWREQHYCASSDGRSKRRPRPLPKKENRECLPGRAEGSKGSPSNDAYLLDCVFEVVFYNLNSGILLVFPPIASLYSKA